jgi:hypothetical protein
MMTRTEHQVLICNSDLVETEYLRREYGLVAKLVEPNSVTIEKISIIACTDPSKWIKPLSEASDRTVIFFLLGNETYGKLKYEYLNNFSSVLHVFVYNPPRMSSKLGLLSAFDWLCWNPLSIFDKHFFFAWRFAKNLRAQSSEVDMEYEWTPLPLGYTNQFVSQLEGEFSSNHISLFDGWPLSNRQKFSATLNSGFMGQVGTWYRKVLLEYFARFPEFASTESSGWVRGSTSNYVEFLNVTQLVLCPPGIYTNETFRYYETLVLGSLPIAPINTVHDFHTSNYWTSRLPWYLRHSHIATYRFLRQRDSQSLVNYVLFGQTLVTNEIEVVQDRLRSLLCERI